MNNLRNSTIIGMRNLLSLVCCWLLGSDFLQVCVLAMPVCPKNTFWNPRIEDCDDCGRFCVATIPQYMQVCKAKCPSVYAELTSTTTTAPTLTSLASLATTLGLPESPAAVVDSPVSSPGLPVWAIVGICVAMVGGLLASVIYLHKKNNRQSSDTPTPQSSQPESTPMASRSTSDSGISTECVEVEDGFLGLVQQPPVTDGT